jgi:hypothetical protein
VVNVEELGRSGLASPGSLCGFGCSIAWARLVFTSIGAPIFNLTSRWRAVRFEFGSKVVARDGATIADINRKPPEAGRRGGTCRTHRKVDGRSVRGRYAVNQLGSKTASIGLRIRGAAAPVACGCCSPYLPKGAGTFRSSDCRYAASA